MTHKTFFIFNIFLALSSLIISGNSVHAATMYLLSDAQNVSIGREFTVDLKIDTSSASTSINSAEATIRFPVGVVSEVSVDMQGSAFGFWLEGPVVSNSEGTVHFIGGTIKGITGSALHVLRITFKATGVGAADFKIVDAAVTAADGKGTNVLSGTRGVSVAVGTSVLPLLPDTGTISPEQPILIDRIAVPAKVLPVMPRLRVPLYPNESRWYGQAGDVIVLWDLPADVTQVSAHLSRTKYDNVFAPEKILSNGKSFGILEDGIWYVKVQFKNNVGWGDPVRYKISIDTTAPLPFDIRIKNSGTDNPSPSIQFETSDSLSGIANYTVIIDGEELITTTSTTLILPAQSPATHSLIVRANDLAGNSVRDNIEFEIFPLPTPQVEFVTRSVSQGEFIFASGRVAPGDFVEVYVTDESNREVLRAPALVDEWGHWSVTVHEPLAIGRYLFSAISHDSRGAQSLASYRQMFSVRAKSIISIGIIELGWFEIFILAILLIIIAISIWSREYILREQKRGMYHIILGRDIEKISDLLETNIKDLSETLSDKNGVNTPRLTYLVGKMSENVGKMKKYLKQELEKLK